MHLDGLSSKLVLVPLGLAVACLLLWMAMGVGGEGRGHVDLDLAQKASAATPASTAHVDPAPAAPPATSPTSVPVAEVRSAPPKPKVEKTTVLTVRAGHSVELLSAPGGKPVATLQSETEFGSPTVLTVQKRQGRWAGVPTHLLPNGKLGWVDAESKALAADRVGVKIVIDISDKRGRLLRGGKTEPEVEHRWQIGSGAPDSPTPTGNFSITDKLEGADLNPVYGCCAFALSATQPNLPEGWTGGNRMAIHGPGGPLGQELSAGCVWSADEDLRILMNKAPLGTPVEIRR